MSLAGDDPPVGPAWSAALGDLLHGSFMCSSTEHREFTYISIAGVLLEAVELATSVPAKEIKIKNHEITKNKFISSAIDRTCVRMLNV